MNAYARFITETMNEATRELYLELFEDIPVTEAHWAFARAASFIHESLPTRQELIP